MAKNSQDFSVKEAQRLAKTPEGQKLMQLLQQKDSGQLQQALEKVSAGHYKEAGSTLQALLSPPEAKALIQQLGDKHG